MSRMEDINCSPVKLSSAKKRRKVLKFDDCIICKHGGNCVLATSQGAQCLLKVAQQFKDEVHDRICLTFGDSPDENIELYYHRICYQKYTSRTNQQHWVQAHDTPADTGSSPRNVSTEQQSNSFSTRSSAPISWNNCLICGFKKHRGNKNLHVIQSFERANDLLQAAEELKDDSVLCRIIGEDLVAKEGLYHETCMKKYLRSARNVASTLEKDTSGKEPTQSTCAFERLVQEIEPLLFDQDKALGLPLLILRYNELALELGEPKWISTQLKNKLCSHYSQRITVQTIAGKGSPNIILNSKIKLSDAILAAQELKEELTRLQYKSYTDTDLLSSCLTDEKQVQETLRNAAAILSHDMKEVKSKEYFPSPSDIQQNSSEQFVPSSLLNFIQLLLDPKAYESTEEYAPSEEMRRKAVTISECILHSSRNITTPFHLGLAVQLHHNHGSRHLIDTLHSYGLCVSYSELRLFLTSVAEEELKKIEKGTYKPSGIVPVLEGGCLIQEGDDNIDMNIETIDGKNTFHSMARVIFQMNRSGVHNTEHQLIPRGKSRSLQVSENVNDLMNLIHYDKPHKRPEPPRHADALKLVESSMKALSPTKDLTWVLLRMLCRNVLPISKNPIDKQNIPFWTDYNKKLVERQEQYTTVSYAPLIDAKPTDPSTVYTSMVRCMEMSYSLGQVNSIQTMDLQLYAIAQNIKWSQPQRFKNHILRLGGFHEVQCYIAAIGKLWGDAGLLDLLVDSGVYASITAEQMLAGKQYHRAVRGLTLTYEVMMQAYQVEFLKWCELNNHSSNLQKIWLQAEEILSESMQKEKVAEIEDLVESVMEPLMKLFNECGRERSPTFSFWLNFLQAIQVLLLNIRAERESNWDNHIATQGRMLPYIFAADRTNYARYIPVYILDMLNLPEDIKEAFDEGQHTFREIF